MFPYGAVYKVYREHTPDIIRKNLSDIRNLGMNFVVVWPAVYWWEDPALPDYPYHTGKEILRYAGEIGLKVIMETAGQLACLEYAPDFVMKDEYYAVTRDGLPSRDNGHWFFGFLNYFHPEVRTLMRDYLTGIAEQYRDFPALYGYDIWNETMFESHDPHTQAVFQQWLREKYGTIRRLNDAWESTFSDWSQARFSQLLWASVMPFVDYKEFHKDSIGMIVREWKAMMKAADPVHPVIADNIHSMITEDWSYAVRAQDDWVLADASDEMGISFYPKGNSQAMAPYRRSLVFTAVRAAAKDGRYWISEMQSHHQSIYNPFSSVKPHELKRWTLEAVANGAKGLIYWKWNNFQKGLQTFGRGLIDSAGRLTERAQVAGEIGRVLEAQADAFETFIPQKARAAILYDRLCHDFTKSFTLAYAPTLSSTIYTDSIAGLYQCFWDEDIPLDVVTPDDLRSGRVSGYKALFVTGQLNLSPELSAALAAYVAEGGVAILDGKLGEIGEDSLLWANAPGGGLDGILGYAVGDMLPEGLDIRSDTADEAFPTSMKGFYERRIYHAGDKNPEVLARFDEGAPAILATSHGKGSFLHILTMLWYGYSQRGGAETRAFARYLAERNGLRNNRITASGVKMAVKEGEEGCLLFLFNDAAEDRDCHVSLGHLPAGRYLATELFTGHAIGTETRDGELHLEVRCCANASDVYRLTRRE